MLTFPPPRDGDDGEGPEGEDAGGGEGVDDRGPVLGFIAEARQAEFLLEAERGGLFRGDDAGAAVAGPHPGVVLGAGFGEELVVPLDEGHIGGGVQVRQSCKGEDHRGETHVLGAAPADRGVSRHVSW